MAQTKSVNMTPNDSLPRVSVSQYDVGREVVFKLAEGSEDYLIPIGATVKVQGTKPSGLGFSVDATIAEGRKAVSVETTSGMTDEWGNIDSEVVVFNGEDRIGSTNFTLAVERSPHPEGTTDGSAEVIIPELTLILQRIEADMAKAEVLQESEAWAVGERDGVPVSQDDDTYHNNSKWYAEKSAEEAEQSRQSALDATAAKNAAAASKTAADGSKDAAAAQASAAAMSAGAAAAAADRAEAVFSVAGDVAFAVNPDGSVTVTFTEEE